MELMLSLDKVTMNRTSYLSVARALKRVCDHDNDHYLYYIPSLKDEIMKDSSIAHNSLDRKLFQASETLGGGDHWPLTKGMGLPRTGVRGGH